MVSGRFELPRSDEFAAVEAVDLKPRAARRPGNPDVDRVIRAIQADLGTWWSIPKVGLHLALGYLILWHPSRKMISMARLVIVAYIAIIINNFYFAGLLT